MRDSNFFHLFHLLLSFTYFLWVCVFNSQGARRCATAVAVEDTLLFSLHADDLTALVKHADRGAVGITRE